MIAAEKLEAVLSSGNKAILDCDELKLGGVALFSP